MQPRSDVRAGGRSAIAGVAMTLLGVLVGGVGLLGGGSAAMADITGQCVASSRGVAVHFLLAFDNAHPGARISGVRLSGFDQDSCDGKPAIVTLSGNQAGNRAQDPTELLSTLDSSADRCTGTPLTEPGTVVSGSIALRGCRSVSHPDGAAFASVHDVTRLTVEVAGHQVQARPSVVLGAQAHRPGTQAGGQGGAQVASGQPGSSGSGAFGQLPNTGGPARIMLLLGIVLVIFGIALVLTALPRRGDERAAAPSHSDEA